MSDSKNLIFMTNITEDYNKKLSLQKLEKKNSSEGKTNFFWMECLLLASIIVISRPTIMNDSNPSHASSIFNLINSRYKQFVEYIISSYCSLEGKPNS